ncbi:SDR family oxidoreductase [Roseovarius indicus]|uniref:2-keto-3-deoxy-L-fuconate dehydrogenase n=1 Tax=Roseovarius indicus TaxID=540747 RepID=A0A0T5PCZ5_9RHOB|nr:SDR family oxidoreductase [Roseovarius indicus]KRS19024.1 oxidoreductase [Roseovarius indicus]OAO07351.1 NAD(P)-dependent oxidoreductase [Roseovarius indicus]QEW26036.1 2-keto-3-deoxy-L-fuconate dehydrogenase [Roseovarius indicus]SFD92171.1 2-keto-3-deoxy-L-fuconate dehydrogenase [Roseovarius indicus]
MRLKGKRAFITAAGQGIGRASAAAMAREGAHVIATDLNGDLLEGLDVAESFALDALDKVALVQAVGEAQPDILVNCSGIVHSGTILDATDEEFDLAMNLNVRAHFHAIQAAVPGMLERGTGSIVNIASVCSSLRGLPNRFIYGTSKGATIGLTKQVAADYITQGIRCNCIAPGTVDSPSLQQRLKDTGDYEAAMKAFVARQPMGRLGEAEEIADLVVYLASDETRYMTGQCVAIDGGMTM